MCATNEQNQIEQEQHAAYTQALDLAQKQYGNQQEIFGQISDILQPILKAGPSQRGFSAGESNNLNSQAIEGTATNYKAAAQALGEQTAARGGGSLPLEGGPQIQQRERLATSAAESLSKQQDDILQADYDQGNKNWLEAVQGMGTIATGENPLGYATAATGSGTAAANEANQIASENNSWINAALGAAGSVGAGFAKGRF
jgi:hypothetical protein